MAKAVEFLVTLDFQHPLQAYSCWSVSKELIFFMLLPTLFTFLPLFCLCPWYTDF